VVLALIGNHFQFLLIAGEQTLPNTIGLAAGILLIIAHRRKERLSEIGSISSIIGVAVFGIILAGNFSYHFFDQLKALTLLTLSLVMGYGLYLGIMAHTARIMRSVFLGLVIIILFGCALEAFTPLGEVLKQITSEIWDYNQASQAERDLIIFDSVRPTFLTSEPSSVAKGIIVLCVAAALAQPTIKAAMVPLILLCLSMAVVGSPTSFLGIPMILGSVLLAYTGSIRRSSETLKVAKALALGTLLGLPLVIAALVIFADRLALFLSGDDTSSTIRLFAGLEMGFRAILVRPIAGFGLGGTQAAESVIVGSLLDSGLQYSVIEKSWDQELTNAIGAHLLQFGIVVLFFYIAAWMKCINRLSSRNGSTIAFLILVISFALGNIYSPFFICAIFIFCAAVRLGYSPSNANDAAKRSRKRAGIAST
jgi:hypothetical protein